MEPLRKSFTGFSNTPYPVFADNIDLFILPSLLSQS